MNNNSIIKNNRDYLTNLFKHRSILALCSGICTLALSFYGIISNVIRTIEIDGKNGFSSFTFYTTISNTLALFSVAFIIPFAIDGIQKKRFVLPKWIAILHHVSTTTIAIMLFFVLAFMSWASPEHAFMGTNLILHIFCPTLILISFFQIENGYIYSVKNRFIGCIPFYIYAIIYFIEVVLIGEANGGWADLYQTKKYMPPIVAMPFLLLFGTSVSWLIASISNYLTKKRKEKMYMYMEQNAGSIETKIEAYGLGNMIGQIKDENNIFIPLDILNYMAEKSQLSIDELIKSYIAGIINSKKLKDTNS